MFIDEKTIGWKY